MSFIANRVYNIVQGVNYDPVVNGNIAVKFKASIATGSTAVTVISFPSTNPIAILTTILGTTGQNPVITGPGFSGRETVTAATGNTITTTNPAGLTGTFDFYAFDDTRPSSIDAPITAFHVVSAPGTTAAFTTLTGDTVNIPGTGLAVGGIYEYGIRSFTTLSNANSLRGLAPANKSLTL